LITTTTTTLPNGLSGECAVVNNTDEDFMMDIPLDSSVTIGETYVFTMYVNPSKQISIELISGSESKEKITVSTGWKRIQFQVVLTAKTLTFQFDASKVYFYEAQLESGSVVSGWKLSESDIDESVDKKLLNYSTKEELATSITENEKSITLSASRTYSTKEELQDVDGKLTDTIERVSKSEAKLSVQADQISSKVSKDGVISAINQTAESVTIDASKVNLSGYLTISGASGKYTTQTDFNTGIESAKAYALSLESGCQMLRGTNTVTALTSSADWNNSNRNLWRAASGSYSTRASINVTDSPNPNIKKGWSFTVATVSSNNASDIAQDNVPVVYGEKYTMSCYARCTSGKVKLRMQSWKSSSDTHLKTYDIDSSTNSGWARYSFTFTHDFSNYKYSTNIYFGVYANYVGVVEICGMKLERGDKVSEWGDYANDTDVGNIYTDGTTTIDGGLLTTGSVIADALAANSVTAAKIATDAIKSRNYVKDSTGSYLNLSDGSFSSKNLSWDSSGKLTAKSGYIGDGSNGWTIDSNTLKAPGTSGSIYQYCSSTSSDYAAFHDAFKLENAEIIFARHYNEQFWTNYGSVTISRGGITSGCQMNNSTCFEVDNNGSNSYGAITIGNENSACTINATTTINNHATFSSTIDLKGKITLNAWAFAKEDWYIVDNSETWTNSSGSTQNLAIIGKSSGNNIWIGHYNENAYQKTATIYCSSLKTKIIGTLVNASDSAITSDKRLKSDIESLDDSAIDFILGLSPSKFKYVNGTSGRYHLGFIAQDVEETMNDTIGDAGIMIKDDSVTDDGHNYKEIDLNNSDTYYYALRYGEFISPIVKTIQYLNERINKLEKGSSNNE
jgi:hypothetical protein